MTQPLILPPSATQGPLAPLAVPFDAADLFSRPDLSETAVHTLDGGSFDFKTGDLKGVTRRDLARALSRIPRFCGQTSKFYSVAEHSLWVAAWLGRQAANQGATLQRETALTLAGLLHDAHEALFGDVPSPLKRHPIAQALFGPLQSLLDNEIYKSVLGRDPAVYFSQRLHPGDAELLFAADRLAYMVEHRDLRAGPNDPRLPQDTLEPVEDPELVAQMFLDALEELHPSQKESV